MVCFKSYGHDRCCSHTYLSLTTCTREAISLVFLFVVKVFISLLVKLFLSKCVHVSVRLELNVERNTSKSERKY